MSTTSDSLQALFANLKPRQSPSSAATNTSATSQPRSSNQDRRAFDSSALQSTPISPSTSFSPGAPDASSLSRSNMPSPLPADEAGGTDRARNLLSLLKFSQPELGGSTARDDTLHSGPGSQLASGKLPSAQHEVIQRGISSSNPAVNVMTSSFSPFIRGGGSTYSASPAQVDNTPTVEAGNTFSENPQDALLRLLNRGQSLNNQANESVDVKSTEQEISKTPIGNLQQVTTDSTAESSHSLPLQSEEPSNRVSPVRMFGSTKSRENTPFEATTVGDVSMPQDNKPIFTYTNPFEALNVSRRQPLRTRASSSRSGSPALALSQRNGMEDVGNDKRESDKGSPEPGSTRRKLKPRAPFRPKGLPPFEVNPEVKSSVVESPVEHAKSGYDNALSSVEIKEENPASDAGVDVLAVQLQETAIGTTPQSEKEAKVDDLENGPTLEPHRNGEQASKENGDQGQDAWESADESHIRDQPERVVSVYNFPIKPFVSITMNESLKSNVGVRNDGVMEISRLKKEFDQLDRTLVTATSKYITYALVRSGGLRIIRQEDGSDRQVFKNSHDRIFNVSLCTTAMIAVPSEEQAVLAIGVSGSVYYATISREGSDFFEADMLESESLVFPPFPHGDENTAGGTLKTRAKKSSRHPEFFAIARGKAIHLVWPATAMSSKYGVNGTDRTVDMEKFYKDRSLKISTGKAGKDFTFSEDDSLIVSLDKMGRLRFWDIRLLVEESNATASKVQPVEIRTPLLTLSTASPAEKSWPTSVLFIDKLRPYPKGVALRYVLVGLKQNHTLQLWDIALGKAVQEINFPHEGETDGICSVCYHPPSGIIVVGHPTRNSIYFIHLSAPRYMLTPMTQAMYIERVAAGDSGLPKLDSTACMSGIREMSFASKGQLRSLDLLSMLHSMGASTESSGSPLFELYVVHSRGVTCLNIRKDDLGWSSESKVLHPIDAVEEGHISLRDLRLGTMVNESGKSNGLPNDVQPPPKSTNKGPSKNFMESIELPSTVSDGVEAAAKATVKGASNDSSLGDTLNEGTPTEAKRKKKRSAAIGTNTSQVTKEVITPPETSSPPVSPPKTIPTDQAQQSHNKSIPETSARGTNMSHSVPTPRVEGSEAVSIGISGDWLDKEMKKIENGVNSEFRKELNNLYRNIENDRNVQDSAAVARQEAVLRLISTTLSTNVEKSLGRMVVAQIQQIVVPAISSVTTQAISVQAGDSIARVLHQMIPHELSTHLPVAINSALQNPQFIRTVTESVSQKIAATVEVQIVDLLRNSITPAFKSLAASAAEKPVAEVEKRFNSQIRQLEAERRSDNAKVEQMSEVLQGVAETLRAMSDAQVAFQGQILKDRRQFAQISEQAAATTPRATATMRQTPAPAAPPPTQPKTKEELELEEIGELMNGGQYEEGSIKWLQSAQQVELFDKLFSRFTPDYLATDVSPLVAFSVGVTVANSLTTNTAHRLDWINAALDAVDLQVNLISFLLPAFSASVANKLDLFQDPEIADLAQHAPALLNSVIQKLENFYMQTAEKNSSDPILRVIPPLTHKARAMKASLLNEGEPASLGGYYR